MNLDVPVYGWLFILFQNNNTAPNSAGVSQIEVKLVISQSDMSREFTKMIELENRFMVYSLWMNELHKTKSSFIYSVQLSVTNNRFLTLVPQR